MPDPVYGFSERDRAIVREVIRIVKSLFVKGNTSQQEYDYLAPEVYIAQVPGGGIPAIDEPVGTGTDGWSPGTAIVDIFQILWTGGALGTDSSPELIEAFPQQQVFNISQSAITALDTPFVVVAREKYGKWVVLTGAAAAAASGTALIVRADENGSTVSAFAQEDDGGGGLQDTGGSILVSKFSYPLREDFVQDGYYIAVQVGSQYYAETGPQTTCINVVTDASTLTLDCDSLNIAATNLSRVRVLIASCATGSTGSTA